MRKLSSFHSQRKGKLKICTLSPQITSYNTHASPKCTLVDLIIATTTMFFKPQKNPHCALYRPVLEEICHIKPTCTRFPLSLTYRNNGEQKRMEPGFSSVLASARTSIELCKYPGILRQSDSPDDQQGVREVTIPRHAIQVPGFFVHIHKCSNSSASYELYLCFLP